MHCPKCGKLIDPAQHGDLVFDSQVWCSQCFSYEVGLTETREFAELVEWSQKICAAFCQEPVSLERDPEYLPDPRKYWRDNTFLLAEADHQKRLIMLYPPGMRLTTLCHELAHIFTGQDHTAEWASINAKLTAWVKSLL
ncbi:hypothetical protein [Desulfobacca acetoxidans]|uniref:Uncharacterized protein n=1 Tax=Desulfobacca acetoxidans (strain ATCC 700848 / DSM 11109 / ASRB2) TaxID=880072 RepID=F2NF40_DESAR|nr:hypothetical protein [Desulfobacca acetoxidans]AEB08380.1 hypothetical protein Desac_0494 [Desulfobacca acetoxidans DSM 11109]